MRPDEVEVVWDFFIWIQTMIKPDMCKAIWGDRWEHYWGKWEETGHNIIYFWARLDQSNKRRLIQHYEENAWT